MHKAKCFIYKASYVSCRQACETDQSQHVDLRSANQKRPNGRQTRKFAKLSSMRRYCAMQTQK